MSYNDIGNANRLINKYGDDIRFCHDIHEWFIWKEKLWGRDEDGQIFRFAVDIVRDISGESCGEDADRIKARNRWAKESGAAARIRAMIDVASHDERVAVTFSVFDKNKFLFNVQDGTIELNSDLQQLREHRREDLITKISPVAYHEHMEQKGEEVNIQPENKRWNQFLSHLTEGDEELAKFLQRAIGYSMSGDTKEEKLFFVHGTGGTGKGTFIESIKRVMGDYAKTADFNSFVKAENSPSARNDLARLVGARFVVSNEMEDGKQLAEDVVKNFTGNDKVTARFLFKEHFEFYPNFKLWLVANDPPIVSGEDDAMWRRILRISLDNKVEKKNVDVNLKKILTKGIKTGQAILAWMVAGYAEYRERGLDPPQSILDATEEYRKEMEEHPQFFVEILEFGGVNDKEFIISVAAVWEKWVEYAKVRTGFGKARREFNKKMESRGAFNRVVGTTRCWKGVRFRDRGLNEIDGTIDLGEEDGEDIQIN